MLSDGDSHTVRRIEAFSDIVIGFCLAEVGVNLAFPKSGDAATLWLNVGFFLAAFGFIAIIWWFHHRLFTTFFVLNQFTLVLNFIFLAGIVLTTYFLQLFVHAGAIGENAAPYFRLWAFCFANVYTLLGILLAIGMWMRRDELAAKDIRWGFQRIASILMVIGFFVIVGTPANFANGGLSDARLAVAFVVAMIVLGRIALPMWLKRAIPDPK